MIRITARHMVGGRRHEHIASVRWSEAGVNNASESTREEMVTWLDSDAAHRAIVGNYPSNYAEVGTVHPADARAYIRTYADGVWTDNLLALPEY